MVTCTNIKCDLYNKVIIKSKILKSKRCLNCGKLFLRKEVSSQISKCPSCKNGELEEVASNKLWDEIERVKQSGNIKTLKELYDKLQVIDRFRILDKKLSKD